MRTNNHIRKPKGSNRELNRELQELKRRKRHRRRILFGVFSALFLGILMFCFFTRITEVTVTGSSRYSEEELISMIFKEEKDFNTLYAIYRDRFGEPEDIPFIEKYHVRVTGLHSAQVTVYEKSLAGCLEYMGIYMYFDKDGVVVESSGELTPMVPLVTGLKFENIVMYETLTVEDESVFGEILNISQLLSGHELSVDRIAFDSREQVSLYVGGIRAVLGDNQYMADKISEFNDILPQIKDRSGTLYLDEYEPDAKNPSYPFVQNTG